MFQYLDMCRPIHDGWSLTSVSHVYAAFGKSLATVIEKLRGLISLMQILEQC